MKLAVVFSFFVIQLTVYQHCSGHNNDKKNPQRGSNSSKHRTNRHGNYIKNIRNTNVILVNNKNKKVHNNGHNGHWHNGGGGNNGQNGHDAGLKAWCDSKGYLAAFIDGWCFAITSTAQVYLANVPVCPSERNGRMAVLDSPNLMQKVTSLLINKQPRDNSLYAYQIGMRQIPGPNRQRDNWYWMMGDGVTKCKSVSSADIPWYPPRPNGAPDGSCGYIFGYGNGGDPGYAVPAPGLITNGLCSQIPLQALCQYGKTPNCPLAG